MIEVTVAVVDTNRCVTYRIDISTYGHETNKPLWDMDEQITMYIF